MKRKSGGDRPRCRMTACGVRKARWTVGESGLLLLLVAVSCALAGLGVIYVSTVKECQNYRNVCTTPACVTAAAQLLQNMDRGAEPCQNFYRYACGGWLNRHVIPETSSRYSVFDILRDELETVLKGVLETQSELDREAFQKAKVLYASCMNESVIEKRGGQPLLDLIDFVGGWPVASADWNANADYEWSLEDTLALFNSRFHKTVLFDMLVWVDDLDSNQHVLYIDQPGLGLPTRDYYVGEDEEYKTVREAYLHFMTSVMLMTREARNLTSDEARVQEDALHVMQLETDLANATSPSQERQDVTLLYNKIKLYDFHTTFTLNGFNWTRFMVGVLSEVFITVKPDEEVVVYCTPYLQKLGEVLARYSKRTLRNYLTWHLVIDRVSSLSQRFKDARSQYKKSVYRNTKVDARWRDCVRYVQNTMENAVGALYVKKTFAGESKRMVRDLISRIQEAFVETLDELSWMDDQSKKMARDKAMAIKYQIGYPDFILEEENDKLDLEYQHLNFSEDTYFENMLQNLHAAAQKSLRKLREPVNNDFWMTGVAVVNAFYSTNRNQIVFPAGILQPPFYSKEQPQALNFGGIGMVIGHEITHGFDDNGRKFDRDGNMLNWWSNFSAKNFRAQSECMVQQYGSFKWDLAGGQNLSGVSTLGENIADNGGIRQAYKAYKKWREAEGEEPCLPGLDLNNEQLFFLNFAQVWCGKYRPEYANQIIRTDSHSPLDYRVLGSLQNFNAFSEAFHCKPGSPMNPPVKCRVW
ncbi:membrane metallo-endopeptidase-like 1 isoform X2 [Hoplias malabaricus]|uniref:membrane metallo-endopeptidase-like 1 isoform X2 n=1 Tax=Hoplias malabaricus TaxID=27720 RepID=UPI0034628B4D